MLMQFAARGAKEERLLVGGVDLPAWPRTTRIVSH